MLLRISTIVTSLSLLLACGLARAHYLWIEPGSAGAMLFYGEAEALLKETSPGRLDRIGAPRALATPADGQPARVATLERMAGHIAIHGSVGAATITVQEESLPVRDLSAHGLGRAKTNYYARHGQPVDGAASLPLDVRVDGAGALTVLYRGQALAHAKFEVIAPNTWVQEHKTNARGQAHINTPWRGLYVLHVLHVDRTPGQFSGQPYDNLRQHFTYSFTRESGSDAGPAVAPRMMD